MTVYQSPQIPLRDAYLCPQCDTIGQRAEGCPHCANKHVLTLSTVLNRQVQDSAGGQK